MSLVTCCPAALSEIGVFMPAKQRDQNHLIDQNGVQLLRSKLPEQWVLREYRPDYGLDFAVEVFKRTDSAKSATTNHETLGEHLFIQLKSAAEPQTHSLAIYSRRNVEKGPEVLDKASKVVDLETYPFQLEVSELITVERMGVGVPVLLAIADLKAERCSFVCLNFYVDKILIPRHADYRSKKSRTIHVPVRNEIGTPHGLVALRWYAKRAKLLAAFQRFTYQHSELQWAFDGDWRKLAETFAHKVSNYDFWDDTEMCVPIAYDGAGLRRFMTTGQPGFIKVPANIPPDADRAEWKAHFEKLDVFELWRLLSLLPRVYEDVWREWFLPTSLGHLSSSPD